ncbi:hypothetical protein SBA2_40071 [Acidobacteriia bacterium SbA2]|nr:hypothetical protein SBA2_40071 [Acidobacteriia bacterium SbA2]
MNSIAKRAEAWRRLQTGESLTDLSLPKKNGRIDLSGLVLPKPKALERWHTPLGNLEKFEPNASFHRSNWRDIDFSESKLHSICFEESEISNCCFDRCELRNLRFWATTIQDCSFRGADLRESGLGLATIEGPLSGMRNKFVNVDFAKADLRNTVYVAAAFERCSFRFAKLINILFGTSTFKDCSFEGELREVRFWRSDLSVRGFPTDAFPPNEMINVDFSHATLRDVEFRGLTLDRVQLPCDSDHIVIDDFPDVLDKLIGVLKQQGDQVANLLIVYLSAYRKWTVPGARGVLNRQGLADLDPGMLDRLLELLAKFGNQQVSIN